MLEIGRLNRRVTIMKRTEETDELGQTVNTGFAELKTVWATIAPLRGSELWEAQKVKPVMYYRITIRYLDGLSPDMRVRMPDGKLMDITAIVDKDYRHEYQEIMCTEHIGKDGD